eukprot:2227744-Amphidinium_carterae.2
MVQDTAEALQAIGLRLNPDKTVWTASPTALQNKAEFFGRQVDRSDSVIFLGTTHSPSDARDEDLLPRISEWWGI